MHQITCIGRQHRSPRRTSSASSSSRRYSSATGRPAALAPCKPGPPKELRNPALPSPTLWPPVARGGKAGQEEGVERQAADEVQGPSHLSEQVGDVVGVLLLVHGLAFDPDTAQVV